MENEIKKQSLYSYSRVGKNGQLNSFIEKRIENRVSLIVVGAYIRVGKDTTDSMTYNFEVQKQKLEEYFKENNITNRIIYIDMGFSAMDNERPSLNRLISDCTNGKINKIVVTDMARLFRDVFQLTEFLENKFVKNINIKCLDNQMEDLKENKNLIDILMNNETPNDKEINLDFKI